MNLKLTSEYEKSISVQEHLLILIETDKISIYEPGLYFSEIIEWKNVRRSGENCVTFHGFRLWSFLQIKFCVSGAVAHFLHAFLEKKICEESAQSYEKLYEKLHEK